MIIMGDCNVKAGINLKDDCLRQIIKKYGTDNENKRGEELT